MRTLCFRNDCCKTRHWVGTSPPRPRKTRAQAIHTFAPVLGRVDFIDTKCPWASQQLAVGGGRWNAGHLRQRRSLTCHLTVHADALAAKKYSGRALRNRCSSEGPRFNVWNEGYNAFLFGSSDRRLNISCQLPLLRGLTIRPNEQPEEAPHQSELTEQMSSIGPDCYLSKLWSDSRSSKKLAKECGSSQVSLVDGSYS